MYEDQPTIKHQFKGLIKPFSGYFYLSTTQPVWPDESPDVAAHENVQGLLEEFVDRYYDGDYEVGMMGKLGMIRLPAGELILGWGRSLTVDNTIAPTFAMRCQARDYRRNTIHVFGGWCGTSQTTYLLGWIDQEELSRLGTFWGPRGSYHTCQLQQLHPMKYLPGIQTT